MFKKIFIATALATVSSFATWDLFPVLENHKGEAKIGTAYTVYEYENKDYSILDVYAGLRSTIIPNLEIAFNVPYRLFTHENGYDAEMDKIGNIVYSTRYQFIPIMNAFVDVFLPVGDDSYNEDEEWTFDIGLQFSTQFNTLLNLGSQLGFSYATEGFDDDAPIAIKAAVELDFKIIPEELTAYVGTDFSLSLGAFSNHDYQYSHNGGDVYLAPYIGATYTFEKIEAVSIDASLKFGKHVSKDSYPDIIAIANLALLYNF